MLRQILEERKEQPPDDATATTWIALADVQWQDEDRREQAQTMILEGRRALTDHGQGPAADRLSRWLDVHPLP